MKLLFLLTLLLSTCTPLFVPDLALVPDCPESTPCLDCSAKPHTEYEAEAYYRGVYSLCMVLNAKAAEGGATRFVNCTEMVRVAHDLKWHERDVPGFEWPPQPDLSLNDTAINYVK